MHTRCGSIVRVFVLEDSFGLRRSYRIYYYPRDHIKVDSHLKEGKIIQSTYDRAEQTDIKSTKSIYLANVDATACEPLWSSKILPSL